MQKLTVSTLALTLFMTSALVAAADDSRRSSGWDSPTQTRGEVTRTRDGEDSTPDQNNQEGEDGEDATNIDENSNVTVVIDDGDTYAVSAQSTDNSSASVSVTVDGDEVYAYHTTPDPEEEEEEEEEENANDEEEAEEDGGRSDRDDRGDRTTR